MVNACKRSFTCLDGCLQDFRDGQIGTHSMISAFRHSLGHGDDRALWFFRHYALRVEDAILESFAKFRRCRIVLAGQSLRQAAEHLRKDNAGTATGTKDSRCRYTARKAPDAVILRFRQGHDSSTHRAQDMRSWQMPGTFESVDLFIFQQKLTVGTGNHALEIAARDYFTISCHIYHTHFFTTAPVRQRQDSFYIIIRGGKGITFISYIFLPENPIFLCQYHFRAFLKTFPCMSAQKQLS